MQNAFQRASTVTDRYEAALLDACRDLLGAGNIAAGDNFFDLGGSSLQAFVLIETINQMFSLELNVLDLVGAERLSDLVVKMRDGS